VRTKLAFGGPRRARRGQAPQEKKTVRKPKRVSLFYAYDVEPTSPPAVAAAMARTLVREAAAADRVTAPKLTSDYFRARSPQRTDSPFGSDFYSARGMGQLEPVAGAASTAAVTPAGFWSNIGAQVKSLMPVVSAAIQKKLTAAPKGKKPKAAKEPAAPAYTPLSPKSGLPGWAVPVAVGGVVVAGLVLFFRSRK